MKRLAVLAFLVLAGCGSLGAGQPHTLALAFKSGDTYKYKFHATSKQTAGMAGMSVPINVDTTAAETVTVKSVDSSGGADVTIALSGFTLKTSMGGVTNTTTGEPADSVEVTVHPDGTVASVNGQALSGSSMLTAVTGLGGGFFIAAVLPDHAVKPGDTWSKTYDQSVPHGTGGVHVVTESTYVRDESTGGVNAAVVETKSTGSIDITEQNAGDPASGSISVKGTFTTDVTTWIDSSGHRVVKSHSTAHDDVTIQLPSGSAAGSSPMLQGPVTAKGDSTTDLNPA